MESAVNSSFVETFTKNGGQLRLEDREINTIYAYRYLGGSEYDNLLKIGDTRRSVDERVSEQDGIGLPYSNKEILYTEEATFPDGSIFRDHKVHAALVAMGKKRLKNYKTGRPSEFFECTLDDVKAAIKSVKSGNTLTTPRICDYKMRKEQQDAVDKTFDYFERCKQRSEQLPAKFLWNAKMRFGKTFTAYQLARKMQATKVLVVTFQPVVGSSWENELNNHVDFDGWQYISHNGRKLPSIDFSRPFVWFVSFQDILTVKRGIFKERNKPIFNIKWDLVILDEYHYGAWRDKARSLFESDNMDEDLFQKDLDKFQDEFTSNDNNIASVIDSDYFLYLSGTPFRAINSGEFSDDQIYTWSYVDEQAMKYKEPDNPSYSVLPKMFLFTYGLPSKLKDKKFEREGYFNLNEFFKSTGIGNEAKFVYEEDVCFWLELLSGSHSEKMAFNEDSELNPYPFACVHFKKELTHTFWLLPSVSACDAMENLLTSGVVSFFDNYTIINESGSKGGSGQEAYDNVMDKIGSPNQAVKTRTITLSCGKLTMGVTVAPWTGVLMLCSLKAPETYFQAAFRAQSPWLVYDKMNHTVIQNFKSQCYVFDFDPNRTLRLLGDYCSAGFASNNNTTEKIKELLNFMPVITCEDSRVKKANVQDIVNALYSNLSRMDYSYWQSPDLFNLSIRSLSMLSANDDLSRRLQSFKNSSSKKKDEYKPLTISDWNKYNQKKREKGSDDKESDSDQHNLTQRDIDKERKYWREKLKFLSNRINVFMYLTDPREQNYLDILDTEESELFEKVTGLDLSALKLVLEYGLLDRASLNQHIWGFMNIESGTFEEYLKE